MALTPEEQAELDQLNKEEAMLSRLSPEEQAEYLQLQAEEQIAMQAAPANQEMLDSQGRNRALQVGLERGATFGARPAIAGLAAATGTAVEALTNPSVSFSQVIPAFQEARQEAKAEQEQLSKDRPGASAVGEIAGSVLTAPLATGARAISALGRLLPAGKALQAAKVLAPGVVGGAAQGLGTAIGEAESLDDAVSNVIAGAVTGGVTSGVLKGVSETGKLGMKVAKKVFPTTAATKIAESITGVPQSLIKEYSEKTMQLDMLGKKYGKDFGEVVDASKEKILKDIRDSSKAANESLKTYFKKTDKQININDIIEKMEIEKKSINAKLYPDDIAEIDNVIAKVKSLGNEAGEVGISELYDAKKYLQDVASGSYLKDGQIFAGSDKVSKAAKSSAAMVRSELHKISPDIKNADEHLSRLHQLESKMVKSILKTGLSANPESFLTAGAGTNRRGLLALEEMSKLTGKDFVTPARELAAAKQFANAPLVPMDTTGKTVARIGVGAGIGALSALGLGNDVPQGALIGAALASPFALKKVIQGTRISGKIIRDTLNMLNDPKVNSVVSRLAADKGIDINTLRRRMRSELYGAKE